MSEIVQQLEAALAKVALLVIENPAYAPIFERLELELEQERAFASDDIVARARAITAQRQMAFA